MSARSSGAKPPKDDAARSADRIGGQLRHMYQDLLAQPVPDRFLDLLKALDAPAAPAPGEPVPAPAGCAE